jgi:hypothetical protein
LLALGVDIWIIHFCSLFVAVLDFDYLISMAIWHIQLIFYSINDSTIYVYIFLDYSLEDAD